MQNIIKVYYQSSQVKQRQNKSNHRSGFDSDIKYLFGISVHKPKEVSDSIMLSLLPPVLAC